MVPSHYDPRPALPLAVRILAQAALAVKVVGSSRGLRRQAAPLAAATVRPLPAETEP